MTFLTSVMDGIEDTAPSRFGSHLKNGPPRVQPASVANTTTVKDKLAQVMQHYRLTSVPDRPSAEILLQAIKPALEAAGITVLGVSRNKIQMPYACGQTTWIDVIPVASDYGSVFQGADTREDSSPTAPRADNLIRLPLDIRQSDRPILTFTPG